MAQSVTDQIRATLKKKGGKVSGPRGKLGWLLEVKCNRATLWSALKELKDRGDVSIYQETSLSHVTVSLLRTHSKSPTTFSSTTQQTPVPPSVCWC
jgi:hypothetical protein